MEILAYIAGWRAAATDRQTLEDNPRSVGGRAWQAWRDGWFDQDDDASLVVGATDPAVLMRYEH